MNDIVVDGDHEWVIEHDGQLDDEHRIVDGLYFGTNVEDDDGDGVQMMNFENLYNGMKWEAWNEGQLVAQPTCLNSTSRMRNENDECDWTTAD